MNNLGRPFGLQFLDGIGEPYEENIAKDGDYENEEKFGVSTQYSDPYAYQYESEESGNANNEAKADYSASDVYAENNKICCCCSNGSNQSTANGNGYNSVTISTSEAQKDNGEVGDVLNDKRFWFGIGIGALFVWGFNRIFSKKDNKKEDNKKGE